MKLNKLNTATYKIGTQLYPIILVVCKNPLFFINNQSNENIHITLHELSIDSQHHTPLKHPHKNCAKNSFRLIRSLLGQHPNPINPNPFQKRFLQWKDDEIKSWAPQVIIAHGLHPITWADRRENNFRPIINTQQIPKQGSHHRLIQCLFPFLWWISKFW